MKKKLINESKSTNLSCKDKLKESLKRELILFKLSNFYKNYYNKNIIKIIVARYNENLNWLNPLNLDTIVFNKGHVLNIDNEIRLKNVGRESHTYLNYIINNYNNLPEYLVFTQGNISDHFSGDYAHLVKITQEAIDYSQSIPKLVKNTDFGSWSSNFNLTLSEFNNFKYKNNKIISFKKWFIKNIYDSYPKKLMIYKSAIFAVSKKKILSNSIDYYKNLISYLDYDINPIEGHFMERSWYYIFNKSSKLHPGIII